MTQQDVIETLKARLKWNDIFEEVNDGRSVITGGSSGGGNSYLNLITILSDGTVSIINGEFVDSVGKDVWSKDPPYVGSLDEWLQHEYDA